ncbi:MAG: DUF169 domain-containing protein [Dehalococcoidales bacterium]|nr:DUF169 domain-containing protein [Dehalococcoidales bacterium]
MRPLQTDLSIYSRFKFERTPVGVNYSFHKPEGIEKLDKPLGLCEMVKEAQQTGKPFYITREEENCIGKIFLGMMGGGPRRSDGGQLGVKLEIFQKPAANLRLRTFVTLLDAGVVNYVVFSPIDKLEYEPDLLVIVAEARQAEILLRAMTYSTGEMYESRATIVGECSSLFVYPYLTGKVNYLVTGFSYGMNGRQVYPDGLIFMSIPYQWIPAITQNLEEMKWVPPGYEINNREKFIEWDAKITEETHRESENP